MLVAERKSYFWWSAETAVVTTAPQRADLVVLTDKSDRGGPCYEYRGADVRSNASATRHWFFLAGFPGCEAGTWREAWHLPLVVAAIDAWLDTGEAVSLS
ncbi:hypothetical protein ACFFIC_17135 [Roseomonas vinacea]|uniref:Uncharacterized protein n=1 Tax=Muricoccus vinaceus TaxID=424704 RepID=A0ABV6IVG9_9PROT